MSTLIGHYISGRHITETQHSGPVFNPSTGEEIARCAYGDATVIDTAVKAATSANAKKWAKASHATRL
ncbi:MAG: aldehyde dehydrogenase family protein, partial [Acinetobacter sp.]|nr:aldehyde dehydrogenase family protein [Acinetobacter sp.]